MEAKGNSEVGSTSGCAEPPELSGVNPDMFIDLFEKATERHENMNTGIVTNSEEEVKPLEDTWVRRGEYVIRQHRRPRDTLFSPTQWLYETGNKAIPIYDEDGTFNFLDLENLDVMRETKPDSTYIQEHWDTWAAEAKEDHKMPAKWHVGGMPTWWAGETWFQIARPLQFRCPKSGKLCTWTLGRKTEVRKDTHRTRRTSRSIEPHGDYQ